MSGNETYNELNAQYKYLSSQINNCILHERQLLGTNTSVLYSEELAELRKKIAIVMKKMREIEQAVKNINE